MAINLDVSRTGDIAVVRCRGRIVFGEEADELRRVILSLLKETNRIVLNLAWIVYIDSRDRSGLMRTIRRHRPTTHHQPEDEGTSEYRDGPQACLPWRVLAGD